MTKRNKIVYWISTLWLASGMLATGTLQLFRVKAEGALAPPGVYGITHLGYPIYFLTILAVGKILGVVAVLIPKFPLLVSNGRTLWSQPVTISPGMAVTHSVRAAPNRKLT
jgi:hypothetical protein